MAIAIDASTPAAVGASNDPYTTGSFTAPQDSLLVVLVSGDRFNLDPTQAVTTTPSGPTFTQRHNVSAASNGELTCWTAPIAAGQDVSRTVSATTTESSDTGMIKVWVLTGADTASPSDVVGGGTGSTADPLNVSVTTVTDGAWVFAMAVEWQSTGAPTSTDAGVETFDDADLSLISLRKSAATSPAGSTSLNFNSVGTPLWAWIAIGIKPAGGGGATAEGIAAHWKQQAPGRNIPPLRDWEPFPGIMPPGTTVLTAAVNTASETDTALPLGKVKGALTATETDTALTITGAHRRAVGVASETDTAQRFDKRKGVGVATEQDAAQPLGRRKVRAVGIASESDSAQPITSRHTRSLGVASETDTAVAISRRKTKAVTLASETDTALTLHDRKAVVLAVETDTALAVVRLSGFNMASETDTALTIGRRKTRAVTLASETDAALALGRRKTRALVIATEADASQAISRRKTRAVNVASESDTAQTLGRRKRLTVGFATEADQSLVIVKPSLFNPATETDIARPIAKRKQMLAALEVDTAQALGRAHTKALVRSSETDAAIGFVRAHARLVGTTVETDLARTIGKRKGVVVAVELDTALEVAQPSKTIIRRPGLSARGNAANVRVGPSAGAGVRQNRSGGTARRGDAGVIVREP